MKLKNIFLILGLLSSITPLTFASGSAEVLYDAKCGFCHLKMKPSDTSTVIAHAIMGVMRHVKMKYNNKEEAVQFISEYVLDPQESKSVCMPQKMKRFGLMPSQKGAITEAELSIIADWIYDNFPPANFKGKNRQSDIYAK